MGKAQMQLTHSVFIKLKNMVMSIFQLNFDIKCDFTVITLSKLKYNKTK